ncbi:putative integral membrane protein [Streptococcus salivarius CCHSS3]|jgi:ABC superfamily ATP binding cassette transporter, membrane protein|uniref:ABC transporter permease n=1 Tax=Streptococcus TaxID=1301 RepID=UPI00021466EC|nr:MULTISPECIES: ABC transporter permease [Streptococcus]MBE7884438.1 ABC transporter permease [Streptococcus salivarius]MBS6120293.1 ABC transporter permease [Streptococcus salivarius]MBT1028511.1 ABC transporter permease [Streptococcus salivarius]MCB5732801.1 ABC transporter permease [Streptococcus sp. MSK15_114]MDB8590886.1 ABC transporter permease [Streptococcus salivarius]
MRTLAIAKKVMKELFRDKRTLAMMFVAPVFIMWLMNLMFSASTAVNIKLATQDLPTSLVTKMDDLDHVSVQTYKDLNQAKKDLADEKVDAVVSYKNGEYQVVYANTDASKTSMTRQVLRTSIASEGSNQLMARVKQALPQLKLEAKAPEIKESYQYGDKNTSFFTSMIPVLIGFVVFFFVFLISGMALLKERTSGTLERLLATPVKRSEIVYGYMLSYGLIAILQTAVVVLAAIWLLNVEVVGNLFNVIIVNVVLALVALAFGILLSTLAKSEFQMMQFIPLVIMPQLFFSGIIPLSSMGDWAQTVGKFLPLTYSGDAMSQIILYGRSIGDVLPNIGVLLIFLVILTILNIVGLRRYRKV